MCGGLEVSEAQRLRQLGEYRKLKQLMAKQALDIVGFKAVLGQKIAGSQAGEPVKLFREATEHPGRHARGQMEIV